MKEEASPQQLLRLLKPRLPEMLQTLRRFVVVESPSLDKTAADRCCGLVGTEWRKQGLRVERLGQNHRGDHLRVTWQADGARPTGQILVLGHYDTVYPVGTLAKMP